MPPRVRPPPRTCSSKRMQNLRPSARRLRGVIGPREVRESGPYMVRIPVYSEPGLPRRHCVARALRWRLPDTPLAAVCLRGVFTRVGTGSRLLSVPTRVTNLPVGETSCQG